MRNHRVWSWLAAPCRGVTTKSSAGKQQERKEEKGEIRPITQEKQWELVSDGGWGGGLKQTSLAYCFPGVNTIFVLCVHADMGDKNANGEIFLNNLDSEGRGPSQLLSFQQPTDHMCPCLLAAAKGLRFGSAVVCYSHTIVSFQLAHITISIILTSERVILTLTNACGGETVSDLGLI